MGVQKRMKTIKNYIYMKKKYLTPKITVAELASGGNYLEELTMSPKETGEGIYSEAKKFDEWGDEIVTEGEDDEFYSW